MQKRKMETRRIWVFKISQGFTGNNKETLVVLLFVICNLLFAGVSMFRMRHAAFILQLHNGDFKLETKEISQSSQTT